MANDEHVALLKQGVAAWNAWLKENPDIPRGAELGRANLILAPTNTRSAVANGREPHDR